MAFKIGNGLDLQDARVQNVGQPTDNNDAVRLVDLNSAVEGLNWKDEVMVATQGNLNIASPTGTIDGIDLEAGDRVLVRNQTAPEENGIYRFNGAATLMTRTTDADTGDKLRQAVVIVTLGTNAGVKYRQINVIADLESDSVIFSADGNTAPPASETTAGIIEIATQAETDAGTDDQRAITPLKLKTSSLVTKRATALIGDNSSTQFNISHNFGTRQVGVEIYENSGDYKTIITDVSRPDNDTVRINFLTAPTTDEYRVIITY